MLSWEDHLWVPGAGLGLYILRFQWAGWQGGMEAVMADKGGCHISGVGPPEVWAAPPQPRSRLCCQPAGLRSQPWEGQGAKQAAGWESATLTEEILFSSRSVLLLSILCLLFILPCLIKEHRCREAFPYPSAEAMGWGCSVGA